MSKRQEKRRQEKIDNKITETGPTTRVHHMTRDEIINRNKLLKAAAKLQHEKNLVKKDETAEVIDAEIVEAIQSEIITEEIKDITPTEE